MTSLRKLGDDGHGVLVGVDPQTRGLIQRAAAKFRQRPTEAARDELKTLVDSLMGLPTCTAKDRYDAVIAASKVAEKKRQARIASVQSRPKKSKKVVAAVREAEEAAVREAEEAAAMIVHAELIVLARLSEEELVALSVLSEEDLAALQSSEE